MDNLCFHQLERCRTDRKDLINCRIFRFSYNELFISFSKEFSIILLFTYSEGHALSYRYFVYFNLLSTKYEFLRLTNNKLIFNVELLLLFFLVM